MKNKHKTLYIKTKRIAPFLLFIIILWGCKRNNDFNIDVSHIDLSLEIKRLDKELFEIPLDNVSEKIPELNEKYGDFLDLFSFHIIKIGSPGNKAYPEYLTGFITDYTMNQVNGKIMEVFPDLSGLENDFTNAFKRFKYYFPNKQIPAIYTFQGGFNQSVVVADNILAIGLDKYLGRDCEFYDKLGISNYLQTNMYKEKIVSEGMHSWLSTEFIFNDSINNLINNIIYLGKIQYALDALLPDQNDTLKFGFTYDQLQWCEENEAEMWNYLIEHKLLFETKYLTINKFTNPAPFTSGFPKASPGKAVVWIGREIIKEYMKRNSGISIHDLMLNDNYQEILSNSKYEP